MSEFIIDVAKEKVVASVKMEDGKIHKISSPTFEQMKDFESLQKSDDPEGILKAFEKLGLPVTEGRKIPMRALQKIAERLRGDDAEKK